MKAIIWLISIIALGLALTIAVSGPGARFGLWDFGTGLGLIRKVSSPITIVKDVVSLSPIFTAAALALIGGIVSFFIGGGRLGVFAVIAALAAGGAGMVPLKMKQNFEANPFIHEVTTDFSDPPPIIAAANLPRSNPAEYEGANKAPNADMTAEEAQKQAFPDIQPKLVDGTVDETAEKVRSIIESMNMKILDEGPTDDGWLIQAAYTSTWYGFVDDFIVRLRPEGAMTRVDVRSKSRVGGSDLGANGARVRAFLEKLDA